MSDRLEEIKLYMNNDPNNNSLFRVGKGGIDWLIAEVERLQSENIDLSINHRNGEAVQRAEYDVKIESFTKELGEAALFLRKFTEKIKKLESENFELKAAIKMMQVLGDKQANKLAISEKARLEVERKVGELDRIKAENADLREDLRRRYDGDSQ